MRTNRPVIGIGSALIAASALVSTFAGAAIAEPTHLVVASAGTPYAGFTTAADATPLRVELYEPAIPVPASPQVEFNYSYTNVGAASGPTSTALASALWPGSAVGTGLPTILSASGVPAQLANTNYPAQTNAQYPGTPNSASQEFLPGMVGRVSGSSTQAVARSGYSSSGQVAGDPDSTSNALSQLQAGNLGALGSLLNPPGSNSNTGNNPLGLLSALFSVGGMSSSSVTTYGDPSTVTAAGTSQIGDIELLGGLVKLEGVTVSSVSASSLDGGGKITQKITYGGVTISGQAFKLTSDGIEAAGNTTPSPLSPAQANQALAKLGIAIDIPKPTHTTSGTQASGSAQGPTITMDTQPIITLLQLDKLPLGSIVNQFPASANQLKTVLLGLLQAHPKIVLLLGKVSSSAQTASAINLGGGTGSGGTGGTGASLGSSGTGTTGSSGTPAGTGVSGTPASGTTPSANTAGNTPVQNTSATPGLPPLGSVPSLLILGGLVIAAGVGWFFRAAALNALGAGSTCVHGLVTGLPDLRKA